MDAVTSIKAIRATTGMSQQAFADALGIPKRTIENWETGSRIPPDYVVKLIDWRVKTDDTIKKGGD